MKWKCAWRNSPFFEPLEDSFLHAPLFPSASGIWDVKADRVISSPPLQKVFWQAVHLYLFVLTAKMET